MEIDRLSRMSLQRFLDEYVVGNRPVVITDATVGWKIQELWTPEYMTREYGSSMVQVYNSYFDLIAVMQLDRYLREYFGQSGEAKDLPYVRWYTKLKDVDFYWGDRDFDRFKEQWDLPYFLPTSGYLLPFCMPPETISPTKDYFPARGI